MYFSFHYSLIYASNDTLCMQTIIQIRLLKQASGLHCRTKIDIEQSNIRRWKELSAQDVELPDATLWSILLFIPGYIKYYGVPEPLRYFLYCIWSTITRNWYPLHKKLILQGMQPMQANLQQISHC